MTSDIANIYLEFSVIRESITYSGTSLNGILYTTDKYLSPEIRI